MLSEYASNDMPPRRRSQSWVAGCAAFAVLALVGCARDKGGPEDTQVAVRVNKGEITVHQVQTVLQRQPRLVASAGEGAASRVLDVLIDQELSAQAARNDGLDRDASTIQLMQSVQRESLARAYQDRIAAKVSAPTSDEIDRYYDSRPALFAQRRLYLLQEVALEGSDAHIAQLEQAVPALPNADDVVKALKEGGLRHSSRQVANAAEDLPLAVVDSLAKVDVGHSILYKHGNGARIYTVLHAIKSPIDRRTAVPAIANFLIAERKRAAVEEALRGLRQSAQIEFKGAFATLASPSRGGQTPVPDRP